MTTTEPVAVLEAPPLSVTVSDTAKVPAVVYMCVVAGPVPKVPSPNDQAHDATEPSGSVDVDPSKLTLSGATPVEGVIVMTAVGGRLPTRREHASR